MGGQESVEAGRRRMGRKEQDCLGQEAGSRDSEEECEDGRRLASVRGRSSDAFGGRRLMYASRYGFMHGVINTDK